MCSIPKVCRSKLLKNDEREKMNCTTLGVEHTSFSSPVSSSLDGDDPSRSTNTNNNDFQVVKHKNRKTTAMVTSFSNHHLKRKNNNNNNDSSIARFCGNHHHQQRFQFKKKRSKRGGNLSRCSEINERARNDIKDLGMWIVVRRNFVFSCQKELFMDLSRDFPQLSSRIVGAFVEFCFNNGVLLYKCDGSVFVSEDPNIVNLCISTNHEISASMMLPPSDISKAKEWFLAYCDIHGFRHPVETVKERIINDEKYFDVNIRIQRCIYKSCKYCLHGNLRESNGLFFVSKNIYCTVKKVENAHEQLYMRACNIVLGEL